MNRYILLAAGVLALATGCDNGSDDSSPTGGAPSRQLFCAASSANADAAMVTLNVSSDMNTITMTETPQSETDATDETPGSGTAEENNEAEPNESGIPAAGITFTRVADDDSGSNNGNDTVTFTSAAGEGSAAMTMSVDQALLEGNATGHMTFGNQSYNCSTDASVANPENPDDENTGNNNP